MRSVLRYAAALAGTIVFAGLVLELASLVLLEVSDRWPTRAEIRETLAAASRELGGVAVDDPKLPMLRDFVLHPYVGFVRNYDHSVHVLNRRPIELPVNSLGFVGELPPTGPPEQRLVVGITGGSVAAELFLFSRERLRSELAAQPAVAGREIEIVSFALAGMKQPQQLMALNYLLSLGHHLDVVVNLDGFNEVALPLGENTPFGVSPVYPRNWRGYAAKALDEAALFYAGRLEVETRAVEGWRRSLADSPLRHSSLALLLWNARLQAFEAKRGALEAELRQALAGDAALGAQTRGPPASNSPDEVLAHSVEIWKRSSTLLSRLCESSGISYFHFLQPNLYVPGAKPLSEWEADTVAAAGGYRYGPGAVGGYPLLIEAGEALRGDGVAFEDLTSLFEDERGRIYRDACCHYVERGYDLLARRIASRIGETISDAPTPSENARR